jgi:hypothetical protein
MHLARQISPPTTAGPGDALEIKTAYVRLLKAGLADLPEDGGDEESLNVSRPGSPEETIVQLERHDPRAIDFRNSLRNWFRLAPWPSIRLLEVQKWLYWSMYNADMPPLAIMSPLQKEALKEALNLLQKRTGWTFPEGSNPEFTPLRLTIDPVYINWRPLTFYIIIGIIHRWLRRLYTNRYGATFGQHQHLEYLLRVPKGWDNTQGFHPVVFIHGLGLGLLQYHRFISNLLETVMDRPILIPLQPQISQDFFHPQYLAPVSRHQMANTLASLLDKLGWVDVQNNAEGDDDANNDKCNDETEAVRAKDRKGVTMLSHSK